MEAEPSLSLYTQLRNLRLKFAERPTPENKTALRNFMLNNAGHIQQALKREQQSGNGQTITGNPWVLHDGADCPVPESTYVLVLLRGGKVHTREKAGFWHWKWDADKQNIGDIMAYCVVD